MAGIGATVALAGIAALALQFRATKTLAGRLEVSVSPAAAVLTLDGKPARPGSIESVAPGAHFLAAKLDGYEPVVQSFTSEEGQTAKVALTLTPLPGRILVAVNVPATCTLQGGPEVQASEGEPATFEVAPGEYRGICRREGYETTPWTASVRAGSVAAVEARLKAELKGREPRVGHTTEQGVGKVTVNCPNYWCRVVVDRSRAESYAPASFILAAGRHHLRVMNEEVHLDAESDIEVSAGKSLDIRF